MITLEDLKRVALFGELGEIDLVGLAERAADVHLDTGQWLVREGEEPRFFVVLEGELEITKDIVGQSRVLGRVLAEQMAGEMAVLMGTSSTVTLRALTTCRVARFERQQLQELMRQSPSAAETIFRVIGTRTAMAQQIVKETPSARVRIFGSKFDPNCRSIRAFLSANRVQYDWIPPSTEQEPGTRVAVVADGETVEEPNLRRVAEALCFQTKPKQDLYDVVIVGAGPAGMAASVYSASEGLSVIAVDRFCVGGQAGTSSRIENYLGFPAGISGNDLSERALKQAARFGVEVLVTRSVEKIEPHELEHNIVLDCGDSIRARVVLLATGVSWNRLSFPNHDRFIGRGILYGASLFDRVAIAGHRIFIVGGGNSAGQAAVYYSGYAAEVVLLVRGPGLKQSMSQYLVRQLEEKANIRVEPYTQVTEAHGDNDLERIKTSEIPPQGSAVTITRDAKALFIMTGATAKTEWLPQEIERNAQGYVLTGRDLSTWGFERMPFALETSIPGIFCAGDVRNGSIKRVASSVGEGSMSVSYIHEYLAKFSSS